MLRIILQRSLILIAAASVMHLQAAHYVFIDKGTGKETVIKKELAIFDAGKIDSGTLTTTSTTEGSTVQLGNHAGQFGTYRGLGITISEGRERGHLRFDEMIGVPPRLLVTYESDPTLQRFSLPIYQWLADLSRRYSNDDSSLWPCNRDILLPSGPFATGSISTTGVLRVADVTRDGEARNRFNIVGYLPFYPPNQQPIIFVRVNINIAFDEEDRTISFTMSRAEDDVQQVIGDFQLTLIGIDETTMTSAETRGSIMRGMRIPPLEAHNVQNRESAPLGAEPQDSASVRYDRGIVGFFAMAFSIAKKK